MEIEKLNEWNPWWEKLEVTSELKGRSRKSYNLLLKSINVKEITIITGVRRSGKSTLMYQMIDSLLKKGIAPQQILFINCEDKKLIHDSLDDLYLSYRQYLNIDKKAYIFLDEIQRKEGWELWIRKKYDLKSNDKFIISGSSSHLLKKEYSTLLTGRNITFEVFPLSFEEFLFFHNIEIDKAKLRKGIILETTKIKILKYLRDYLNFGGFPEVLTKASDFKIKLLEQYFDDIIYKDIVDRYDLNAQKTRDITLFFMTSITSLISLRNIRNVLKIAYDTVKEYLSYCKEAFLIFTLEHFSYSYKEQKTRASKVYCIDNGLRNAVSFKFSEDRGKLIENLTFLELKRRSKKIYYWKNKNEVDFIIKNKDNSLSALNVTDADEINKREISGLMDFKKEFKIKTKDLIILTRNIEKSEGGIIFMPLWKWLLIYEEN